VLLEPEQIRRFLAAGRLARLNAVVMSLAFVGILIVVTT
jgi:hypothetical protein